MNNPIFINRAICSWVLSIMAKNCTKLLLWRFFLHFTILGHTVHVTKSWWPWTVICKKSWTHFYRLYVNMQFSIVGMENQKEELPIVITESTLDVDTVFRILDSLVSVLFTFWSASLLLLVYSEGQIILYLSWGLL